MQAYNPYSLEEASQGWQGVWEMASEIDGFLTSRWMSNAKEYDFQSNIQMFP